MHKLPGKRKISYGSDPVAPEAPVAAPDSDSATVAEDVSDQAIATPDLGEVIAVQDLAASQNPAIADTLAKFNVVKTQLLRSHNRYLVKWEIALIHEGRDQKNSYYGRVNDISENGLSMFCDYNVFFDGRVKLVMSLPPLHIGAAVQKIEVESRMVYTILSQYAFRLGLEFLHFRDGEKKILMDRLESSNAALRPSLA
ncbi:PilZ domain-containing protein [Undibacterium sp. Di27W]|uniref:PilZ domain-containing protein n=1 Tax=Undibacterium sp. Di27W TaxID=3413036 RepID=UPI003BF3C4E1